MSLESAQSDTQAQTQPHPQRWYVKFYRWFLSREPREIYPSDPKATLYRSCHITAKCRYNASIRLKNLGFFSFLTVTVLSLGLILIPIFQLSGLPPSYPPSVVNSLQIFLAVAVLVYSVINATAHYETRAQSLNECGDRIKELSRELRSEEQPDLHEINRRYTVVSTDSENHSRTDYHLAMLQARNQYNITGCIRLWFRCKVLFFQSLPYAVPTTLMFVELIVILDIFGITHLMTPRLTLSP